MKFSMNDLNAMGHEELTSLDDDTEITGFARNTAKSMWVQAVEYWSEDGGWWYDTVINGFKGWAARSDFEIYCDLRFTYIDGQDMSWDEFWDEAEELGKHS